jgi:hypothetical protein
MVGQHPLKMYGVGSSPTSTTNIPLECDNAVRKWIKNK